MKLQPYVSKLGSSKEFKTFQKEYPDSFMVAGFFVLDLEMGQNLHQLDYYIPSKKKFAAFTLDKQVQMQLLDAMTNKTPEKLDIKSVIDLDALKGILEDEMKNRSMTEEIKKIIAVLQNIEGKKIWNTNCVLSGMEILKAHIEDNSKSVLKMEKISIMDLMKSMPGAAQMPGMQAQGSQSAQAPKTPKDVATELKKLEAIEAAIAQEKAQLQKNAKPAEKKTTASKKKA